MQSQTIVQIVSQLGQAEMLLTAAMTYAEQARMGAEDVLKHISARDAEMLAKQRKSKRPPIPLADQNALEIRWRGKVCVLTKLSFKLFQRLLLRPNASILYERLMEDVWQGVRSDSTIRSAVRHLKHQLRRGGFPELADAIVAGDHLYAFRLQGH